jgi:5-(carboxyamino)imidazole ribonucleotide synthase
MKIGIVGAGQLGRMLAVAGYPLALRFEFLDSSSDSPAGRIAPIVTGAFDDAASLRRLADRSDVLTYEFENVPVEALEDVTRGRVCLPPLEALRVSQDRLYEKELFRKLGIATPPFRALDTAAELEAAVREIRLPAVLKTRRLGYDGRGQHYLRSRADVARAWDALGGVPLILEGFVDFDAEVSLIGARSTRGEVALYPLTMNEHKEGILRVSTAPHRRQALQRAAERSIRRLFAHFGYAGVLTVEFFVQRGRLVANEMAPRVHNSGHWTIEGAATSQFENHLRAILGWPLGGTAALGHVGMVNFIGAMPDRERLLAMPGVHFHDFGKTPRAGRKLGHCTVVASTAAVRDRAVRRLRTLASRASRSG